MQHLHADEGAEGGQHPDGGGGGDPQYLAIPGHHHPGAEKADAGDELAQHPRLIGALGLTAAPMARKQ